VCRCAKNGIKCVPSTGPKSKVCVECQRVRQVCKINGKSVSGRVSKRSGNVKEILEVSDDEPEHDEDTGEEEPSGIEDMLIQQDMTNSLLCTQNALLEALLQELRRVASLQHATLVAVNRERNERLGLSTVGVPMAVDDARSEIATSGLSMTDVVAVRTGEGRRIVVTKGSGSESESDSESASSNAE